MRTIKFKGKSLMNGQWFSGDLAHSLEGKLNILGFVEEEDGRMGFTGVFQVDPSTVCQFTGFTDKNGKEVMKATYCGPTSIRSVVPKPTSMIIITAR